MDKEGGTFPVIFDELRLFFHTLSKESEVPCTQTGEKLLRLLICLTEGGRNLLSIALSHMKKPFR